MRRLAAVFLAVLGICGILLLPLPVHAFGVFDSACGAGGSDSAVCQEKGKGGTNPLTGSGGLLMTIANLIALVSGVVAVFIILLAGWRYITSGGDPSKIQGAKSALIYSIVGLVVIAASDLIIRIVLSVV